MAHNGWTNRETWLVNLWLGDALFDVAQESGALDADQAESFVCEVLAIDGATVESGLAIDLLNSALGEVNWWEIAQAASEGVKA